MSNCIEENYIAFLEKLVSDKAAMANLRRGLGKPVGTAFEMDRYILPFIAENTYKHKEKAYYIVSSLFAFWHQGKDKAENSTGNLGYSLKILVDKEVKEKKSNKEDVQKRIEKYLVAILNANSEDLSEHLRRIISLLKANDVSVNWTQLLLDIQNWNADDRKVQHNWSKGFWIYSKQTEQTENPSSMDENN